MLQFTVHNEKTAPEEAKKVLKMAKDHYGFIPNLAAVLAEAPPVLEGVLALQALYNKGSLSDAERNIVLLTTSVTNACEFCTVAHTATSKQAGVPSKEIARLLGQEKLSDPKQEALRQFTRKIVSRRGDVEERDVLEFLNHGYTKAQVFEVIMGVSLKTLTNYAGKIAKVDPNPEFIAAGKGD